MPETIARHPLRPAAYWQSHLQRLYSVLRTMDEQAVQDLNQRCNLEREVALIHRYLGQPGNDNLLNTCEYGAALALIRVCGRRSPDFVVKIRKADASISIKADQSVNFGWSEWLNSFSLALLLQHKSAISILETPGCIDACALPFAHIDRFWPFLCGAFAALVQGDSLAKQLIEDTEQAMRQVSIMEFAHVENCFQPLLPLMHALLDKDQNAFTAASLDALESFKLYYLQQPDGDAELLSLYNLPLSAMLAQGRAAGLNIDLESEYLLSPVSNQLSMHQILAQYPALSIYDAIEADWFMRVEGFENHSRSTVIQKDNKLFACYRAENAIGIPLAELDFELLESGDNPYSENHSQPALDVGQLIHSAELFAGKSSTSVAGNEKYQLEQSVIAIDLALQYLQAMGGEIDPSTLHSETGKLLYQSEPGRFRPQRLLTYRNSLASQAGLPQKAASIAKYEASQQNAEAQVYALIEELKPFLLPVLQAIASDPTGEVIRALQPKHDDYAKVFSKEVADIAERHYAGWWQHQQLQLDIDENTRIDAHMAPAGMLGDENGLSYHFPNGYQSIAHMLNPHRIWVSWKYYQLGETAGYSLNGLVWIDDRWAWFPKPYKIL